MSATKQDSKNELLDQTYLPHYISPTVKRMTDAQKPPGILACASCPAGMWLRTDVLKCFCSRMHLIVWEKGVEPILDCDGREFALLDLLKD